MSFQTLMIMIIINLILNMFNIIWYIGIDGL